MQGAWLRCAWTELEGPFGSENYALPKIKAKATLRGSVVWSRFFTLRASCSHCFFRRHSMPHRARCASINYQSRERGCKRNSTFARTQPSQLCKNGITTNRVWFLCLAKKVVNTHSVPSTHDQRKVKWCQKINTIDVAQSISVF